MNTIDYVGLTDIAAYTALEHPFAAVNGEILNELTGNSVYNGLYEPLSFLNLLHGKFALLRANKTDSSAVIEHLRALELGFEQRRYLYRGLILLAGECIRTAPENSGRWMLDCKSAVETELRKVCDARYEPEKHRVEMERKYHFEGKEKKLKHYDPIKDLDAYMDSTLNMDILWMLTEDWGWESTFEPLAFFRLLYKQFEIACDNRDRPIALRLHLLGLGLDKDQLYFFLHFMLVLIGKHPDGKKNGREATQLLLCGGMLEREYQKLMDLRQIADEPLLHGDEEEIEREKAKKGEKENEDSPVLGGDGVGARFALSPKFAKTDLIRLLSALHHMRLIHTKDGMLPTKEEFMRSFAEFLSTDLGDHSSIFSRSVNTTSREANMKVFKELSESMEALIDRELKAPKK
jgi:hypothetical protein